MKTQVKILVNGKRFFFEEDVDVNTDMHGRLRSHHASVVTSRLSCDVLVVRDIANPGVRTLWVAILLGCPIVSCQTIINQGRGLRSSFNRQSHVDWLCTYQMSLSVHPLSLPSF